MDNSGRSRRLKKGWKKRFLETLANTGNIRISANAAGIHKSWLYILRERHPEFAQQWDDAIDDSLDILEAEGWRRAVKGNEKPIFHKGEQIATVREYSDTLLIFFLKGGRPEKYRDNFNIDKLIDDALNRRNAAAHSTNGAAADRGGAR